MKEPQNEYLQNCKSTYTKASGYIFKIFGLRHNSWTEPCHGIFKCENKIKLVESIDFQFCGSFGKMDMLIWTLSFLDLFRSFQMITNIGTSNRVHILEIELPMMLTMIVGLILSVTETVADSTAHTWFHYSFIITTPVYINKIYPGSLPYKIRYSFPSDTPIYLTHILPYTITKSSPTNRTIITTNSADCSYRICIKKCSYKDSPAYRSFIWCKYDSNQRPKIYNKCLTKHYITPLFKKGYFTLTQIFPKPVA